MKHLFITLTVFAFSINSFAQVEFGAIIEDSINQQSSTAADISNATQTASNENLEDDLAITDTVKTNKLTASAADTQQGQTQESAANQASTPRQPSSDKDFKVRLQPTGRAVAAKYFPPAPKVKKVKRSKLAKNSHAKTKAKSTKVAKASGKVKKTKSSRTTASIAKKSKSVQKKKATGSVASH